VCYTQIPRLSLFSIGPPRLSYRMAYRHIPPIPLPLILPRRWGPNHIGPESQRLSRKIVLGPCSGLSPHAPEPYLHFLDHPLCRLSSKTAYWILKPSWFGHPGRFIPFRGCVMGIAASVFIGEDMAVWLCCMVCASGLGACGQRYLRSCTSCFVGEVCVFRQKRKGSGGRWTRTTSVVRCDGAGTFAFITWVRFNLDMVQRMSLLVINVCTTRLMEGSHRCDFAQSFMWRCFLVIHPTPWCTRDT